jgi:hypothetical protein
LETRGGPAWSDDIRGGSYRRAHDSGGWEDETDRSFLTQEPYPQPHPRDARPQDAYFTAPGRPAPPPPVSTKRTVPLWATVAVGAVCLALGTGIGAVR